MKDSFGSKTKRIIVHSEEKVNCCTDSCGWRMVTIIGKKLMLTEPSSCPRVDLHSQ